MSKLTAHRACVSVISASFLVLATVYDGAAETVTLSNGQTYEVETDDRGEPLGAENREVEVTLLAVTSHASPHSEAPVLEWVLVARLKRNRSYTVTVTTPIDESVSESFEVDGRGESVRNFLASDASPAVWSWLEQPGTSWIPWVIRFENTESDDSFEFTQWTKFPT